MMRKLFAFILLFCTLSVSAQTEEDMLLGKVSKEDLIKAPHSEWFDKEYGSYQPDGEIINKLNKLTKEELRNYTFTIFLGTWCGDSHREVPRFVKTLEKIGVAPENIQYVALNTGEGVEKQSPTGEEKGKYIFRVPTFIISKSGAEVGRITEYPVESLERDLFSILSCSSPTLRVHTDTPMLYTPNYRSYTYIQKWVESGLLTDENVSPKGLAEQIRGIASSAGEINSAAYVLVNQGKNQEAAMLCKIAAILYPETTNYYTYAYVLSENGQYEEALMILKKYLVKATNTQKVDWGLELYDKIKNKQK